MKVTRLGTAVALAAAGAVALGACGSSKSSNGGGSSTGGSSNCPSGSIAGSGSTFQKNIELQWISDFGSSCKGLKVDYQGIGSGAGIQAFINGTVDFAGSDSLMKDDEQASADKRCGSGNTAEHIPITAGAAVFTYNIPGVTSLQVSAPLIAKIFSGKVTKWNDPAVKADNPSATLPDLTIQPVHRSDSSGTTGIMASWLTAADPTDWTLGTSKDLTFPGGQSASGSDGVTGLVKSTPGAITYTELSYALANSLTPAKVKNTSGAYVDPSGAAVSSALSTAKLDTSKGDTRVTPDYTTSAADAYPVSAISYVIVCTKGNKNAAALKAYLTYAVGDGQKSAGDLGYAPLPDAIDGPAKTAVAAIG
ncbi:MAG TPA: phosphate ABC transporter substrate-binding protein PstS [Mycobacteriales bacterium]|nr:phosphate ABC transporter substrate-binding protein PstS [Mycobacteriales bacterium]